MAAKGLGLGGEVGGLRKNRASFAKVKSVE